MHFVACCIFNFFSGHGDEVRADLETGRALVKRVSTLTNNSCWLGKENDWENVPKWREIYLPRHGYEPGMEGYV